MCNPPKCCCRQREFPVASPSSIIFPPHCKKGSGMPRVRQTKSLPRSKGCFRTYSSFNQLISLNTCSFFSTVSSKPKASLQTWELVHFLVRYRKVPPGLVDNMENLTFVLQLVITVCIYSCLSGYGKMYGSNLHHMPGRSVGSWLDRIVTINETTSSKWSGCFCCGVHLSVVIVFTSAQTNCTKGETV